ncbi:MAG: DUF1461 domain-containing protein [Coriobacteriia bacterium]|nr:DUF1461 domain-containing protein [Coriobacteriia bacterium]
MKAFRALVYILTTLCLAVTFVGAGLAVCMQPLATTIFAGLACPGYAENSPFTAEQLVEGAKATREYTVGNHNLDEFMQAEMSLNLQLYDTLGAKKVLSADEANMLRKAVSEGPDTSAFSEAQTILAGLGYQYHNDEEVISHLDDVYNVIFAAVPVLAVVAVLAIAGSIFVVRQREPRTTGAVFTVAGGIILAVFAGCGIWAAADFYSFFSAFHSLFFTGDSWVFYSDSLLICTLPQAFWICMGALWLGVTALLSLISLVYGIKQLRKR